MIEPKQRVELTADVAATPDETFTFLTDRFDELWQGSQETLADGKDPSEPFGLGFRRRMKTPLGTLEEEIVTHDRPGVIEYVVTDGDVARFHNHLGRIELSERPDGGTHIDYVITYDFKPPALGPVSAAMLKMGWQTRGKRKLRSALG